MTSLRFRQIHLDFHTSPKIEPIGQGFDSKRWQECLLAAEVDSVTLFAKCHHGVSYHPTKVGTMHPGLNFNLLRAQYNAVKAIGIHAPIYLSAGVDNVASNNHPEWREIDADGSYAGRIKSPLKAGYHAMDFHSPYLDYLCEQIREVVQMFPDCDGIFLDIIRQSGGCSCWSLAFMQAHDLDPAKPEDRRESCRMALEKYYQKTTSAARELRADMPIFHNSGHISRGQNGVLQYFSHLELESLPTGGWGYDHFPLSAKYACNLGMQYLGMTGKFHTTWGEVGGFKHPNALRYECAAMLAFGARCSVGDQLHPTAELDVSTYQIIGQAYREVAAKEEWVLESEQLFDIGVLSSEAENGTFRESAADEGASRILLEGHFLFAVIDRSMDFNRYKVLLLPDDIRIDFDLKAKLDRYLNDGGRLLMSGESGLWKDSDQPAFDLGAAYEGLSPYAMNEGDEHRGHDYVLPIPELRAEFIRSPLIMYERSHRVRVTDGQSLGDIFDPYFMRRWDHFSGHQHTPNRAEASGYACGVRKGGVVYLSHPVFRHYRKYGAVAYREFVTRTLAQLIGQDRSLSCNLPSTARISLTHQPKQQRHILHLLYAPTIYRGGSMRLASGHLASGKAVEVIEELPPLSNVEIALKLCAKRARLVPGGTSIELESTATGTHLKIPSFSCHAMIELSG
jgi:hypothetical protein